MKLAVTNLKGEQVDEIELPEAVFGLPPRRDLLHRAVTWQLAKRRAGTHHTQTRAEVRGTGAKPWRQKGTGRARQGSFKTPHMRGGGVAFGPRMRDHAHKLPKKVRRLALKTALSSKARDGRLVVLDEARADSHKTCDLARALAAMKLDSALIIDGEGFDRNFELAARNLPGIDLLPSQGANVRDILRRDTLVLTRAAVDKLKERLQ